MRTHYVEMDLKSLLSGFSAVGSSELAFHRDLSFFRCPSWRNPLLSPILLKPGRVLTSRHLEFVERYFARSPSKALFDENCPYFNILVHPDQPAEKQASKLFKNTGWTRTQDPISVNTWSRPYPFELPEGYSVRMGSYFDKQIHRDYTKLVIEHTDAPARLVTLADAAFRKLNLPVFTVLIYDSRGRACGCGAVSVRDQAAFLFSGVVHESFRGRRLWKVLVSARQALTQPLGVRAWVTTTVTPVIVGKGERSYKMCTFVKVY